MKQFFLTYRLSLLTASCVFFSVISFCQNALNVDVKNPLAPGERSVSFKIPIGLANPDDIELWVFYAKTSGELNNVSANSFNNSFHFGKPVMINRNANLECTFIFPHPNHFNTPNGDLFVIKTNSNVQGLVRTNYPVMNIAISFADHPGIDMNPIGFMKSECVFFRVLKRTRTASGTTDEISDIKSFPMPDSFNIGIAGDSYGSGEGAPNNNATLWDDCACHRSNKSGLLRGVKQFIANFPEVAVDYSFKACSGAKTSDFYLTQQVSSVGNCQGTKKDFQFLQIKNDLLQSRMHDAVHMLIFSGGGNNAGFGDIIEKYLVLPLNLSAINSLGQLVNLNILSSYQNSINNLSNDYVELDKGIKNFFSTVSGIKPIVGITTYPDLTNGPSGRCGCIFPGVPVYPCALYENDYPFSPQAEYELIRNSFLLPLNSKIRATRTLGWNVIDVESDAGSNGLCNCTTPYFNAIAASFSAQSDIYGVVHPNAAGYDNIYREKIYRFIKDQYFGNQNFIGFADSYKLAVALGAVTVTSANCSPQQNIAITGLLRTLEDNPKHFINYSGFQNLYTDLKGLKTLKNSNLTSSRFQTTSNSEISLIQTNNSYQSALNNLPLSQTIIKNNYPFLQLNPVDEKSIVFTEKLRTDFNNYLKSAEFQAKLEEIRKNRTRIISKDDPLDKLYNNN
jgi:hypothetical protein